MKLTEKHHQAIALLVTGMNSKEAAEQIGVAPETVSRWRSEVNFRAELNGILLETRESIREKLRYLCGKSLEAVEDVLNNSEVSARDKITAAFKVLELCKVEAMPYSIESNNAEVLQKEDSNKQFFDGF